MLDLSGCMGFVLFSLVWLVFLPSFSGGGYGRRALLLFVLGSRIGIGCRFDVVLIINVLKMQKRGGYDTKRGVGREEYFSGRGSE